MQINDFLSYLSCVKKLKENSFQAKCPCHKDDKASMTVTQASGKILIKCHAGCRTEDIVASLGFKISDLFEKEREAPRGGNWKERIKDLEAVYDYGSYVKLRLKDKKIRYGHIVQDKFVSGMPVGAHKTLYCLNTIKKAIKDNKTVYITEGEKDADNMNRKGLPCCTAGGTSDWKKEYADHFKGADVVILPDNDEPGKKLAGEIAKDLKNIAFSVRTVYTSEKEKGDVSDFFADGGDVPKLFAMIKDTERIYADWVNNSGKGIKINCGILADSLSKKLKYIILKKSGLDVADFYVYSNGVYKPKSRNEFKGYIKNYIPIMYQTDALLNNTANLILASNEHCFDYEIANDKENLINFKNGLYRLKQNELIPHSASEIMTVQLACNYDPSAKCPNWLKFIDTLCSDSEGSVDESKKAVLQEWFGLLMSNVKVHRTKKCLALFSTLGDTGKSKYLDMLSMIIGDDNTAHIPIQNMSDRFAMGNLYGKRLNAVGDQKSTDIEDSSVFKQLTGGDPLSVEMKGKTAFQFRFKGGFAFACNDLPCFKDDKGGHVFERFTIIKCEHHLKPEERDKMLTDKLIPEIAGIAAWAIEGLRRLQKQGFNFTPCDSSEKTIEEYRGNVDTFFKFINDNYEITMNRSDRVKKTDLEEKYSAWCKEKEYAEIKKKNIKERAAKSGIELGKYQGDWFYRGIKPMPYTEDDDITDIPFNDIPF